MTTYNDNAAPKPEATDPGVAAPVPGSAPSKLALACAFEAWQLVVARGEGITVTALAAVVDKHLAELRAWSREELQERAKAWVKANAYGCTSEDSYRSLGLLIDFVTDLYETDSPNSEPRHANENPKKQ